MQPEVATDSEGNQFKLVEWQCPICKDDNAKFLGYRGGKYHRYKMGIESKIYQCNICKLMYANPFPVPVNPQEIYGDPEKHFEHHIPEQKIAVSEEKLKEMQKRLNKDKIRILDVGSGRGEVLVAAKNLGLEAIGLEFSDAMIETSKKDFGVTVLKKSIEDFANENPEPFDGVILNAVIEHVYDPDSMIEAVSRVLKPGGVLFIETPNEPHIHAAVGNIVNRMLGSKAVYNLSPTWTPYHVYGFNPKSLRTLLNKYGLEVSELKIWADPKIHSDGSLKDVLKSSAATALRRIGNWTHFASNMFAWCKKSD